MLFRGCARIPGGLTDSQAGVVDVHRRSGDGCACHVLALRSDARVSAYIGIRFKIILD